MNVIHALTINKTNQPTLFEFSELQSQRAEVEKSFTFLAKQNLTLYYALLLFNEGISE